MVGAIIGNNPDARDRLENVGRGIKQKNIPTDSGG